MDIGFYLKPDVDIVLVDTRLDADRAVDSHSVGKPIVVAADSLVADEFVVGIPMVDSLMLAIVDRIDRDSWFGGFDNWQLVMAGDIVQMDYVQMDYSHRSDNEDVAMVVGAK